MKKVMLIITSMFLTINFISAQAKQGSTNTCNGYWSDEKKDCSASSGICCLPEIIVDAKIDLKSLADDVKNLKDIAIRKTLTKLTFPPNFAKNVNLKNIVDGLKNGTLVLRMPILQTTSKLHLLIEKVTANSKTHNYVGHVTLLK